MLRKLWNNFEKILKRVGNHTGVILKKLWKKFEETLKIEKILYVTLEKCERNINCWRTQCMQTFHISRCCNAWTIVALLTWWEKCATVALCRSVVVRQKSSLLKTRTIAQFCQMLGMVVLHACRVSLFSLLGTAIVHCWMFLRFITFPSS